MDVHKFRKLLSYPNYEFGNHAQVQQTSIGVFHPSPLKPAMEILEELINDGNLLPNEKFLDAGSGDGRIVALASLLGLDASGVEYEQSLVDQARTNIHVLRRQGILTKNPAIIQGNFLFDDTYATANTSFRDFRNIFHYFSNHHELADKIARDSPKGARFLLFDWEGEAELFDGLRYVKTVYKHDENDAMQVHVYIK